MSWCPSVNEIYFYSWFRIDCVASTPTEIIQSTEDTEWDLDYRVSDNTKSLVKGMLFLLFVLLLEKYSCGLWFFFSCIGHRNYKDFQSKITVCILNKAKSGQSALQRYLVCCTWSSQVFFKDKGRGPLTICSKHFKYLSFYYYWTRSLVSKALTMDHTKQYITQTLRVETIFVKVINKSSSLQHGLKGCRSAHQIPLSQSVLGRPTDSKDFSIHTFRSWRCEE